MTDYQDELAFAVHAVREASLVATTVQESLQDSDAADKDDGSPVTVADFGVQAVIGSMLRESFPDDTVVGEESSSMLREPGNEQLRAEVAGHVFMVLGINDEAQVLAGIDQGAIDPSAPLPSRYWTIDPIDGTKGFVRGEHYAVLLALIVDGDVVVSAMGCPRLTMETGSTTTGGGIIFGAVRGGGAFVEPLEGAHPPTRIHTSDIISGDQLAVCESVERRHNDADATARLYRAVGVGAAPMRLDGAGKYGLVARGDAGIYMRVHNKPRKENVWDHAAGVLILQEAGGRVTDLDGQPLDFRQGRQLTVSGGILATNGAVHDRVLTAWQAL